MLTIRFARVGKRNKAQFRIMLQEHTIAPGGRHIEVLGSYNPHSKEAVLKADRIKYWISKGAQMSNTACNLFIRQGIVEGTKRRVKVPAKKVDPAVAEAEAKKEVVTEVAAPKAEEVAPAEEVKAEETE
ncbi:MAG: 30S ribosomal protein S16 [Candidatus Moranbacteria bacterium CG23_combo_of_CG06-09_8_20_14_all_39_10]|nr:MAG: 30S ribosomal protein S16 [Candidatus Moranbacteria bacterium CG23_combo_of_CG06-09_8_20_14_all_39_10]